MPRSEQRRHFAVEKLPDDLQAQVVDMLREGKTYEQISLFLAEKNFRINIAALSRYFHGRVRPEFEEVKEKIMKRRLLVAELKEIWKNAPGDEKAEEVITQLLNQGIIANEESLTSVAPDKLLREQNKKLKLELEKQRLNMEVQKRASDQGATDGVPQAQVVLYLPENGRGQ